MFHRFSRSTVLLVTIVAIVSLAAALWALEPDSHRGEQRAAPETSKDAAPTSEVPSGEAETSEPPAAKQRRREGDLFEGLGRFESTGDRITFYAEGENEVFRVLENLALERIARILEDPSGLGTSRKWSVTGVVTEYRGSNYLLIERAILKAR